MIYEILPIFFTHCHIIGYNVSNGKWLHPKNKEKEKMDRWKNQVEGEKVVTKNSNHNLAE